MVIEELPRGPGMWLQREEIRNGQKVIVPVANEDFFKAHFVDKGDAFLTCHCGEIVIVRYSTSACACGRRYKLKPE